MNTNKHIFLIADYADPPEAGKFRRNDPKIIM
jgi:hypothetical protein